MADFMAPPLKEKKADTKSKSKNGFGLYDAPPRAEDNLDYGNKKTLKLLDNFAGLVDRKMNMGGAVDIDDLQLLSSEYMKLKEKGVDVSGLDTKINSIKKNYKINQKMKEKGQDPLKERLGKEKEA